MLALNVKKNLFATVVQYFKVIAEGEGTKLCFDQEKGNDFLYTQAPQTLRFAH